MPSLATLLACAAGVSCGPGIHDADEAQSVTKTVGRGGSIEFMGARLDVCDTCVARDESITLTWHRTIPHAGALSSVYDVAVSAPGTFTNDPRITIATTPEIDKWGYKQIGFLENGVWVPDRPPEQPACDPSTVCGPVQIGSYEDTSVLQLAIVIMCGDRYSPSCPAGQSCSQAGACQQCPADSPCP
jgi:hypothetical protein